MSFWSAASSAGQEAYSLAMMLLEMGLGDWRIKIQGTDLNTQMAGRASAARYLQIEVNRGLPVGYLVKYFTRTGLEWQLKDEVRRMVDFSTFDLRQSMSARGPFDVVFCRNVLIYFDVEAKRKILDEIHANAVPGRLPVARRQRNYVEPDHALRAPNIGPDGALPGALKG
jgi:chemotaxis protein methyltransferase CheR